MRSSGALRRSRVVNDSPKSPVASRMSEDGASPKSQVASRMSENGTGAKSQVGSRPSGTGLVEALARLQAGPAEALARLRARPAEALARRRVALGFVVGAAVLWLAQPTIPSIAIGMSVAACGEALRIWAAGHLNKAREVTSSGPYRWLAHPLYVGSSVMGAGVAIASASAVDAALIAVYLVATLTAAIRNEEAFLRRVFGDRYDRYRSGGLAGGPGDPDARRRFTVEQAMANREQRAVAGFLVAILLLLLKATYNGLFWR